MGRKLRYLGPSEGAEIERLHNGGTPAAAIAERAGASGPRQIKEKEIAMEECIKVSHVADAIGAVIRRAMQQKIFLKRGQRPIPVWVTLRVTSGSGK